MHYNKVRNLKPKIFSHMTFRSAVNVSNTCMNNKCATKAAFKYTHAAVVQRGVMK